MGFLDEVRKQIESMRQQAQRSSFAQTLRTPVQVSKPVANVANYFAQATPGRVVSQGLLQNKPLQSFAQAGLRATPLIQNPQRLNIFNAALTGRNQAPEPIRQAVGSGFEAASFGVLRNRVPEPTTTSGKIGRFAGSLVGSAPAFGLGEMAVAPAVRQAAAIPKIGKFAAPALSVLGGGALGSSFITPGSAKQRLEAGKETLNPAGLITSAPFIAFGVANAKQATALKELMSRAPKTIRTIEKSNPRLFNELLDASKNVTQEDRNLFAKFTELISKKKSNLGKVGEDVQRIISQIMPEYQAMGNKEMAKVVDFLSEAGNINSGFRFGLSTKAKPEGLLKKLSVEPVVGEPRIDRTKLTGQQLLTPSKEIPPTRLTSDQLLQADKLIPARENGELKARLATEKFKGETVPIEDRQSLTELKSAIEKEQGLSPKIVAGKENIPSTMVSSVKDSVVRTSLGNIIPPKTRGDISSPELNFKEWKDTSVPGLGRETLERNLEKVAGKDAQKIKDFIVEPSRINETKSIEWQNSKKQLIKEEVVNKLGIKKGSKEDKLIQGFGEGNVSLDELKKQTPKWEQVKQASELFRKQYDEILDQVNKERARFGYNPIPKRQDYFRHYQEITNAIQSFGLLLREQDLPTEIAGLSGIFKPGKPFSTAELQRMGGEYTESAIGGFENYINSISRQIFHIDTVQRGRAFEKYIREAGKAGDAKLPNLVANVSEWTNLVSGKKAQFDRAFEATLGRQIYGVSNFLRSRTSANMVGGNASSAITNFIPFTQAIATTEKASMLRGISDGLTAPLQKDFFNVDGIKSNFLVRRFPEGGISPTTTEKIAKGLNWLFEAVDKFTAKSIVSAKYYEGLKNGLSPETAIKAADNYASKTMADRSIGQLPNLMNTKTLGFITQFQTEVNNQWSFLTKDIPNMSKNKGDMVSKLAQFVVLSYAFNSAYEKITGTRPQIDPIQYGLELAGMANETEGQDFGERLKTTAKDVSGNLPFIGGIAGGRLPISAALPDVSGLIKGETTLGKEILKPATYLLPPFGGGQIKKTFEGIKAYREGASLTPTGRTRFEIPKTPVNALKTAVFGQYSTPEAKAYFKNIGKSKSETLANDFNKLKTKEEKEALWKQYVKEGKITKDNKDDVVKALKDIQLETSKKEKSTRSLPIDDRVRKLKKEFDKLKTKEEKQALYSNYVKKGVITKEVAKKLNPLLTTRR